MSEVLIQDSKTISGNKILTVEIRRNSTSGLEIFVQSNSDLWKPFRVLETFTLGNCITYYPKQDNLRGVPGYFTSSNVFEYEEFPNLSLLLGKDVDKGCWYSFGSFPISEHKLREYADKLKKQAKILFLMYCRPFDLRVEFSTSVVEKEIFD